MANFPRDLNRAGGALALALLLPHPPAHARPPLAEGEAALRRGWYVTAFRLCGRAAREAERLRSGPSRLAALLCQGRAALGLRWPMQAVHLGQQALALLQDSDPAPAHLLLGDAYRLLGDCRGARPHYLAVLERRPTDREAREGLRACASDWPPAEPAPPPLSPRLAS